MPKRKIDRSAIMESAIELVREQGFEAVNARSLAKKAGCSVQPIYSCYQNMEQLMEELWEYCRIYQMNYVRGRLDPNNYFASAGHYHVHFAEEEKNLFRFLFLSKYAKGTTLYEYYTPYQIQEVTESIEQTLGLDSDSAKLFYLDMMIYTHGIAAMVAAEAMPADYDDIHHNINRAYEAFLSRIREERK